MIVVADASPLIALGRIGRLDLLRAIFGELLVPEAVWTELVTAGADKPGATEVAEAAWIKRQAVQDLGMVALLRHDFGAGESEAIVLARERGLLVDAGIVVEQLHRHAGFWLSPKLRNLITG